MTATTNLSDVSGTTPAGIQLGPFNIDHPFILAPMAGITNSPFRRLMRRRQSSLVISELVSANGIEYSGQRTLDLLRYHEEERNIGLQIFGEDLDILARACQHVERTGADFVDLNLGCPVMKVVKKGAGSALCRDPIALGKILTGMVKSVKIPVTIKIRTGWDSENRNALEVVRAAADAGVSWVAIHGRTRAQGYSGLADWDFIGDIKAKSPLPIIGNGDILNAQDAVHRYKTYGVDAVLVGRGALRNPFLFEQAVALLKGQEPMTPAADDYIALIEQQRELLDEMNPGKSATIHARKFLAWYSSGFPGSSDFRAKIFQNHAEPDQFWEEAKVFFRRSTRERDAKIYAEPFLMGGHG